MKHEASMRCDVVLALVPTYVDEEVATSVASSVRQHLMDCQACRGAVQEETSLRQWFVPTEEIEVPAGFAARVARRAFAGDEGRASVTLAPETLAPVTLAPVTLTPTAPPEAGRLLSFSMGLVAVAAAAMIAVTLFIGGGPNPGAQDLRATDESLDKALDALVEENRAELNGEAQIHESEAR